MIQSRNSDAHLHTDEILKKITEYDIFKYYCPNFKQLERKFCSDLREDKSPSVSITQWKNRLWYKDFGHPEHSFDCFSYICAKYACNFREALYLIDNDFNLNLSSFKTNGVYSMGRKAVTYDAQPEPKDQVQIKIRQRQWSKEDKNFWSNFMISKKTLLKFAVCPIDYCWINYTRFPCTLSYAFKIGSKYKIYSPHEKFKWISNTRSGNVQGWAQLPENGNYVVLTSSLKDVMCLYELGFSAVALQSEMQMPEESFVKALKERFKEVIIFYDNDFDNVNNPGQTMAEKICTSFDLRNICIPSEFGVKDISDYIGKYKSLDDAKHLIEQQI
jgi:hypothetical protein